MLYKQMVLQSKQTGLASDADFRQAFNEVRFPETHLESFLEYNANFRHRC